MFENKYRNIRKLSSSDNRKFYFKKDSPEEIWADVALHDRDVVRNLCKTMQDLVFAHGPDWLIKKAANVLYEHAYEEYGKYIADSDFWADQCDGMSRSLMALLQRQYTFSHVSKGCSVVSLWDEKTEEMVCVRSLDWSGADDLAPCTRRFIFTENDESERNIMVAGIAGMVGMLTGMKEEFSICLNYAPWPFSAQFYTDPTFLIRDLLEDDTIVSYADACQAVKQWQTGAPCFINLCGREQGEACVVEFGKDSRLWTREIGDAGYIAQTNHYSHDSEPPSPFIHHNKVFFDSAMDDEVKWYWSNLLKNSQKRRELIDEIMIAPPAEHDDLSKNILEGYCKPPLINYETAQWVVMRPKSMQMDIYSSTTREQTCPENPDKVLGEGDVY